MDYEKKYKDALERAKSFKTPELRDVAEYIFPELKESKGERIRKAMIDYFKWNPDGQLLNEFSNREVFAWLEKQGEQKPYGQREECLDCQFNYAGECKGFCPIKEMHKKHASNTKHNWYVSKVDGKIYDLNYVPEPKFKVGDWITNKGHSYLIANIDYEQRRYLFEVGGYTHEQLNWEYIENADNKYHLWTIQDAKDGDVLFHSDPASNGIFIFKELLKCGFSEKVICYCDYDSEDGFCLGEHHTCCWVDAKILHPATKEQRDLLFTKMKEAGYEWDAEKKELKKIEQNNTDEYIEVKGLSEIEAEADELTKEMSDEKHNLTDFERTLADICIGWIGEEPGWEQYIKDNADVLLKITVKDFNSVQDTSFEQKPAWSKEDERICQCLIEDQEEALDKVEVISNLKKMYEERIDWLKSLKDRVQPQPKVEWSEEDNEWIESLIQTFEGGYLEGFNQLESYGVIDWLKSLKQRITE